MREEGKLAGTGTERGNTGLSTFCLFTESICIEGPKTDPAAGVQPEHSKHDQAAVEDSVQSYCQKRPAPVDIRQADEPGVPDSTPDRVDRPYIQLDPEKKAARFFDSPINASRVNHLRAHLQRLDRFFRSQAFDPDRVQDAIKNYVAATNSSELEKFSVQQDFYDFLLSKEENEKVRTIPVRLVCTMEFLAAPRNLFGTEYDCRHAGFLRVLEALRSYRVGVEIQASGLYPNEIKPKTPAWFQSLWVKSRGFSMYYSDYSEKYTVDLYLGHRSHVSHFLSRTNPKFTDIESGQFYNRFLQWLRRNTRVYLQDGVVRLGKLV